MSYLKKNLKKEYNYYKIEKLINQYPFLFFYHFNNLTTKQKIDLKKKLSEIEKTGLLVIKNKVTHRLIKTEETLSSKLLNSESNSKKSLGASLRGHDPLSSKNFSVFDNQKEKIVSESRKLFNLPSQRTQGSQGSQGSQGNLKKKTVNQNFYNLSPFFQGQTLLICFSSLNHLKESAKVINQYPNLVFIVGLYENQIINHLDYNVCLNLEKSINSKLINLLYSPLLFYPLLSNFSKLLYLLTQYCKDKK
jgi:hypothetical protein